MVIACPCAFGIAAPAAIYSSSFIASKNKILFSSARIYEMINHIDFIAFDKTGTLTSGEPKVKYDQMIEEKDQELIFTLASFSQHPLARAIQKRLKEQSIVDFDQIEEIPGVGIRAIKNNDVYTLVSLKYALENHYDIDDQLVLDQELTTSVFALNQKVKVVFSFEDEIKSDAKKIIDELH